MTLPSWSVPSSAAQTPSWSPPWPLLVDDTPEVSQTQADSEPARPSEFTLPGREQHAGLPKFKPPDFSLQPLPVPESPDVTSPQAALEDEGTPMTWFGEEATPACEKSPNVLDQTIQCLHSSMLVGEPQFVPPDGVTPTPVMMPVNIVEARNPSQPSKPGRFEWPKDSLDEAYEAYEEPTQPRANTTAMHMSTDVVAAVESAAGIKQGEMSGECLEETATELGVEGSETRSSRSSSELGHDAATGDSDFVLAEVKPCPAVVETPTFEQPAWYTMSPPSTMPNEPLCCGRLDKLDITDIGPAASATLDPTTPWTPAWSFADTPMVTPSLSTPDNRPKSAVLSASPGFNEWTVGASPFNVIERLSQAQDLTKAPDGKVALPTVPGLTPLNLQELALPSEPASCREAKCPQSCGSMFTYSDSEASHRTPGCSPDDIPTPTRASVAKPACSRESCMTREEGSPQLTIVTTTGEDRSEEATNEHGLGAPPKRAVRRSSLPLRMAAAMPGLMRRTSAP